MFQLQIYSGLDDGKKILLDKREFHIGRGKENNQLSFPYDVSMSREHGLIIILDNKVFVQDKKSTNGTFIEVENQEKKITGRSEINIGQFFKMGKIWFKIQEFKPEVVHPLMENQEKKEEIVRNFILGHSQLINLAIEQADNMRNFFIGVEHLFLAYARIESSVIQKILDIFSIKSDDFIKEFIKQHESNYGIKIKDLMEKDVFPPVSQRLTDIITFGGILSSNVKNIPEKSIIEALLQDGESLPLRHLQKEGIDIKKVEAVWELVRHQETSPPSPQQPVNTDGEEAREDTPPERDKVVISHLERFCQDLTLKGEMGKIGEIVGRQQEVMRIISILTRKERNNLFLTGESGVGKTAVTRKLAQLIAKGKVELLRGVRIFELKTGSIMEGKPTAEELDRRVQGILREAEDPRVILFIDDLHTIKAELGVLLKPAFRQGKIRFIVTTLPAEYKKHFEKIPYFKERFQVVEISEPGKQETLNILKRLKKAYEDYHKVIIEETALVSAVDLTDKYMRYRRFPEKALDLLDEACAWIKLHRENFSTVSGDTDKIKTGEVSGRITSLLLADLVEEMTNIPITDKEYQQRKYARMEEFFNSHVIGQRDAIKRFSERMRQSLIRIHSPHRPRGVFLFIGPPGVGKTYTALLTAQFLFEGEDKIIRLNMGNFTEKYSISRLVGSSAGEEEEGELTSKLLKNPHSLVLIQDLEVAHSDILKVFRQLFTEGRINDAKGRNVDASNSFFIITTGIASERLIQQRLEHKNPLDRGTMEKLRKSLIVEMNKYFSFEFMSKIDCLIFFDFLEQNSIQRIMARELEKLETFLEQRDIILKTDQQALIFLSKNSADPTLGAGGILKKIEDHIITPVLQGITSGAIKTGDTVEPTLQGNSIKIFISEKK